jgi:hypothetical protein
MARMKSTRLDNHRKHNKQKKWKRFIFTGIALLGLLGCRVLNFDRFLGVGSLGLPRISSSTEIEVDHEDLVALIEDELDLIWFVSYRTETHLYMVDDDGEDLRDELDDLLQDQDWDDEVDWGDSADGYYSEWEKEDAIAIYQILPDMDAEMVDFLDDEYDIEVEEDQSIVLALGIDKSHPADINGPGWGDCDFPESDLKIACFEALDGVGEKNDWFDEEDGVSGVSLETGWITEYNDRDGLQYLEDDYDQRFDLEDDLEDLFQDFVDGFNYAYSGEDEEYKYEEESLRRLRTALGPMVVGIVEFDTSDYPFSFFLAVGVFEEETLITYDGLIKEDLNPETQIQFHERVIRSIAED